MRVRYSLILMFLFNILEEITHATRMRKRFGYTGITELTYRRTNPADATEIMPGWPSTAGPQGTIPFTRITEPVTEVDCGTGYYEPKKTLPGSSPEYVEGYSFPSRVAILEDRKFVCSGTLVSPLYLVTAGQCIKQTSRNQPQKFRVLLMTFKSGIGEIMEKISEIHSMPQYQEAFDLVIMKLKYPVPTHSNYRRKINGICLPTQQQLPTSCAAVGWGTAKSGVGNPYDFIKQSFFDGAQQCSNEGKNALCSRDANPENRCVNDMGSPLMCKEMDGWHIYGVTVRAGSCDKGHPQATVYQRLSGRVAEWLRRIITQ